MQIKPKEKPCKGTGLAKGYGCGKMFLKRTLGLCNTCYAKWLFNAPEAKKRKESFVISNHNKVEKEKKKESKIAKINFGGKLQEKVQEIARLIDVGHECLARGIMSLHYDGGHVYGKGGHSECKYNLHNIFAQDSRSNQSTKEDSLMTAGVERVFGVNYFHFVQSLKNKPIVKHSKVELEQMYRRASKVANDLKKEGRMYTTDQRIEKRNEINLIIGYYPKELSVYETV